MVTFKHISGEQQTSNALTKPLGPLEHWRSVPYLQGTSPSVLQFRDDIEQRYGGRKKVSSVEGALLVHDFKHGHRTHGANPKAQGAKDRRTAERKLRFGSP